MIFAVRRNEDRFRTIIAIAAAFVVFSVLAFFVGGGTAGTTLLIVSGVLLVFVSVEQGKVGWQYRVDETALVVRRTVRTYRIPGEQIESVRKAGWPEIWKFVQRYREGAAPGGNRQVAIGRLIGFSAVSIPVRGRQPTGRDQFVLVKRAGDRVYVLSPAEPDQFVKACQQLMSRTRE